VGSMPSLTLTGHRANGLRVQQSVFLGI
jgi:hypothetical protein